MRLNATHQRPDHSDKPQGFSGGNSGNGLDERAASPRESRNESLTAEAIQSWMVVKLAQALEVQPQDVNTRLPFTNYGLESIAIFSLTGGLAEWLDRDLPPTLLWEYPTIETLARYLAGESRFSPLSPMPQSSLDSLDEGQL